MNAGVDSSLGLVALQVGVHRLLTHAYGDKHLADVLRRANIKDRWGEKVFFVHVEMAEWGKLQLKPLKLRRYLWIWVHLVRKWNSTHQLKIAHCSWISGITSWIDWVKNENQIEPNRGRNLLNTLYLLTCWWKPDGRVAEVSQRKWRTNTKH